MWNVDNSISNGACSNSKPPSVNGMGRGDHNSLATGATSFLSLPCSSENHSANCVTSKFANEKTTALKRVACHSSEASDISPCRGAASASADSDVKSLTATSVNCHSVTRTSRHLYSDCITDEDRFSIDDTDCNTPSAVNANTDRVCGSVSTEVNTVNGVDLRSSFPQLSSDSETVHSDTQSLAWRTNDGICLANERFSVSTETADTSTANNDLTETLAVIPANADLCDDGYIDEVDLASLSVVDVHHDGSRVPWLVEESDACLDDFIDADMPHNATVTGSPSNSSLSSIYDEPNGRPVENGSSNLTDVTEVSESNVSVSLRQHLQWSSRSDERETGASNRLGLSHADQLPTSCTSASYVQPSYSGRCLESNSSHGVNLPVHDSNPASESSHGTPPASLPSPSDDYYVNSELSTGAFLAAVASESNTEVFDGTLAGLSPQVENFSDISETSDGPADAKQNECYWLPIGPESDLSPRFGYWCWSCIEVMNSASLSLPAGYVSGGRPRPCDRRDDGIMCRSATGDYMSHDYSDPLIDDDGDILVTPTLSSRMSTSLML